MANPPQTHAAAAAVGDELVQVGAHRLNARVLKAAEDFVLYHKYDPETDEPFSQYLAPHLASIEDAPELPVAAMTRLQGTDYLMSDTVEQARLTIQLLQSALEWLRLNPDVVEGTELDKLSRLSNPDFHGLGLRPEDPGFAVRFRNFLFPPQDSGLPPEDDDESDYEDAAALDDWAVQRQAGNHGDDRESWDEEEEESVPSSLGGHDEDDEDDEEEEEEAATYSDED